MFTGARSFRKSKDLDLVNFKQTYAKLEGNLFFEERDQKISVNFAAGKRKIFLNDIAKRYPTEMIGKFRVILFTPYHLSLVKDGPENRRRFIDSALCQLNSIYTTEIAKYNKVLKHRNALLKQISTQNYNQNCLDIWNQKLVQIGAKVLKRRLDYLVELNLESINAYSEISSGSEKLNLNYVSSILKCSKTNSISEEEIKKIFYDKLKSLENSDIAQGFTSVGPHKDDLEITLQNLNLKKFGSQGQQRSVILALKLAEASILKRHIDEPPIVLLDDIMSELDDFRIKHVIDKFQNYQTFITGCNKDALSHFKHIEVFKIENGGKV